MITYKHVIIENWQCSISYERTTMARLGALTVIFVWEMS
jgi:hypothetical protein